MSSRARLGVVLAALLTVGGFVAWWITWDPGAARLHRGEPDDATLRFALRPEPGAPSVKLGFNAQGFPRATVDVPISSGGAPLEGRVALVTGATLRVKVLPPADGLHEVEYDVWQQDGSWSTRRFPGQLLEMGKRTAGHEAPGLTPGRYRARDALTGLVTEPVDLASGATAELTLDLSRAGVVTGRVEGPPEAEPVRFQVRVVNGAGPPYSRAGPTRKGETIVKGLGAGKLKVEVRATMTSSSAPPVAVYEIDSTGSGDIPLTHEPK